MSTPTSTDNRLGRTHTLQNKDELRQKVFDERKALVAKWFDKWNDSQRVTLLEDLIMRSKVRQLDHINAVISRQKPVYREDFTRVLPRCISLLIFTFLDPRSLCRCAQVCWYWKTLSEGDDLWRTLCERLNWMLNYTPSPFERTAWKRLYIENIVSLKRTVTISSMSTQTLRGFARLGLDSDHRSPRTPSRPKSAVPVSDQRPPWKGSDPTPRDTWRNNYIENDDEDSDKASRTKKLEASRHRVVRNMLKGAVGTRRRSSSLTRSKSATFFGGTATVAGGVGDTSYDASLWTVVSGSPFIVTAGNSLLMSTKPTQQSTSTHNKQLDATVY